MACGFFAAGVNIVSRRDGRRLFCFGLGFSAQALIRHLRIADWYSGGTARDPEKVTALSTEGIDAVVWDGGVLSDAALNRIQAATHILISTPPSEAGDPAFAAAHQLIAEKSDIQWLGYLSTTGVYGDTGGAHVDETAQLNPSSPRSQRRVDAEAQWMSLFHDYGIPVHVFRLAGIYGSGRSPFDQIRGRQAKRINKPGHAFSRIHVDDIARVLAKSIANPKPGAVYNVCDDEPAPPAEVTAYACGLLGVEPPPLEEFEIVKERMSPMALSFWNDNRRVDNWKIREELGVKLAYPDYRSGLNAVLAEEEA
tara:strand:+ start:3440 stop:4369 length:930 start_codon:yes stop_codon:yes gene_type:complete